jgi:hypothetical protein
MTVTSAPTGQRDRRDRSTPSRGSPTAGHPIIGERPICATTTPVHPRSSPYRTRVPADSHRSLPVAYPALDKPPSAIERDPLPHRSPALLRPLPVTLRSRSVASQARQPDSNGPGSTATALPAGINTPRRSTFRTPSPPLLTPLAPHWYQSPPPPQAQRQTPDSDPGPTPHLPPDDQATEDRDQNPDHRSGISDSGVPLRRSTIVHHSDPSHRAELPEPAGPQTEPPTTTASRLPPTRTGPGTPRHPPQSTSGSLHEAL